MKYYLYISDSKLERLYPQVKAKFWERLRGELGFSFFVNAKVDIGPTVSEEATVKLDAVIRELKKKQWIGTIERPSSYFSGTMLMRSSTYAAGMILYGGVDEETKTTVVLGGASKHLTANLPHEIAPDFHTGSDMDGIMFHLGLLFSKHGIVDLEFVKSNLGRLKRHEITGQNPVWWGHYVAVCLCDRNQNYKVVGACNVLDFLTNSPNRNSEGKFVGGIMSPIQQRVNFVARKLLYEDYGIHGEEMVLIGTPLYVALAD